MIILHVNRECLGEHVDCRLTHSIGETLEESGARIIFSNRSKSRGDGDHGGTGDRELISGDFRRGFLEEWQEFLTENDDAGGVDVELLVDLGTVWFLEYFK